MWPEKLQPLQSPSAPTTRARAPTPTTPPLQTPTRIKTTTTTIKTTLTTPVFQTPPETPTPAIPIRRNPTPTSLPSSEKMAS